MASPFPFAAARPPYYQRLGPTFLLSSASFPPLQRITPPLRSNPRLIPDQKLKAVSVTDCPASKPKPNLLLLLPCPPQLIAPPREGQSAVLPPQSPTQTPPVVRPPSQKSYKEAAVGPPAQDPKASKGTPALDVSFSSARRIPLSTHQGEPALILSKEEETKLALPFHLTLVGKFSHGKPSMTEIRKEIQASLFAGEVAVGLLDYRHVFFKFEVEDDFHRMWSRRTWNFSGFQARLFRWSPEFSPEVESSRAPVWISLPQLPLHFFDRDSLFSIASVVGNPLKIDRATALATKLLRPSEARILVEMDVLLSRPSRVWIGSQERGKWQKILVEDPPQYCTNCQRMGHPTSNCKPQQSGKIRSQDENHKGKKKVWLPVAVTKGGQKTSISKGPVQGDIPNSAPQIETGTKETKEGTNDCNQQPKAMPEPPLNQAETNIEHFLSSLGQFLEFINNQDRETSNHNATPLALEFPKTAAFETELEPDKSVKQGGLNVTINWEEGESSNTQKGTMMSDREILAAMQTYLIDEKEVSRMLRGGSFSDLTL